MLRLFFSKGRSYAVFPFFKKVMFCLVPPLQKGG